MPLDLIFSFFWSCVITLFAVPSVIRVAQKKNLLDTPGLRTVHELPTPRLGGIAIFAGFMSSMTMFADLSNGLQQTLAGCTLIALVGLKDDIITVSALKKFFVQMLAAGIIMFLADIRIRHFHGILGIDELPEGITYVFTFFVIISITNAVNLIDGINGLAGTIIFLIAVLFGTGFYLYGGPEYGNYAALAFCLAGGVLGFLRYNFFKASVFMGDTGSLVCGFIVSVLAIKFVEMDAIPSTPAATMAVLCIPIIDTLRVFIIRTFNGISPFIPDKNHLHHKLMALGISQPWTVCILAFVNIGFVLAVLQFSDLGNTRLLLFMAAAAILLTLFLKLPRLRKDRLKE